MKKDITEDSRRMQRHRTKETNPRRPLNTPEPTGSGLVGLLRDGYSRLGTRVDGDHVPKSKRVNPNVRRAIQEGERNL